MPHAIAADVSSAAPIHLNTLCAGCLGRDKETRRLYALKMQQRPLPSNTVELTYNEITIQAQTGEGHINMWVVPLLVCEAP